jgi:hypothetical protein
MAGTAGAPSLGRSLELAAGDLVFDVAAGDLAVVTEKAALAQALVLAVETQLGTDRLNSGFGFDQLSVGAYAYGIHTRKEYVKMQLVRCLTADRRVRDVREIFFQDDPRFFELNPLDPASQQRIAAEARGSRQYTVYAIVETITADQLTIAVGTTLG